MRAAVGTYTLALVLLLAGHCARGARMNFDEGLQASKEECSCWKGLKPGIGIPGIGSLSCWAPLSCKDHCSSIMSEPCSLHAMCTLSEGDGQHHCDCSLCKGPTQDHVAYDEHCKADTCPDRQGCYFRGCKYSDSGSVCTQFEKDVECRCDYPRVMNGENVCVDCPNGPGYDQQTKKWFCKDSKESSELEVESLPVKVEALPVKVEALAVKQAGGDLEPWSDCTAEGQCRQSESDKAKWGEFMGCKMGDGSAGPMGPDNENVGICCWEGCQTDCDQKSTPQGRKYGAVDKDLDWKMCS